MEIQWDALAFSKIILHAAKYPHCALNGLLLANKADKGARVITIVDTVPLFHNFLSLTPMLEIALCQIDSYCQKMGLTIIGYYHAPESEGSQPNGAALKIASKILENSGSCCLAWLCCDKLSFPCRENPLAVHVHQDGKWILLEASKNHVTEDTLNKTSCLLDSKLHRTLIDFDNHLDNIAYNWRNPQLAAELARLQ